MFTKLHKFLMKSSVNLEFLSHLCYIKEHIAIHLRYCSIYFYGEEVKQW